MNVATTAANNLPKSNNLLVFGGGFIFLVLLAVGLYFALRKKEGDECEPEDSEKVSYAGKYKIDKDGKCKIATCALGYNLTDGSCEADEQESGEDLFVHKNEVQGYIDEGDSVEFEIGEGRKGPCAVNVKKV